MKQAALLLLLLGCSGAPKLELDRKEDLGALPLPQGAVARDGVAGARVGGRILWTFGDTFLSAQTENDGSSGRSATAAWAPADKPLELSEAITAGGIPYQFIPYTDDELTQNRADGLNGWALWPLGQIESKPGEATVFFELIRRINGSGFESRGVATASVSEGGIVATRHDVLFPSSEHAWGAGGVSWDETHGYLFACEPGSCRLARVAKAKAADRSAYEFYDGRGSVKDEARAAVVISGVGSGVSVWRNQHLNRFLAVSSAPISDTIVFLSAERLEGPYETIGELEPDGSAYLPPGENTNYLARQQRFMSSTDGRELVISYSRPTGPFRGEVRLMKLTLK